MKTIRKSAALLLLAVSMVVAAAAQTATRQTLTLEGAEKVIAAARAEAKKLNAPGAVIAVVDDGGNLMALARMDGTFAAGANISIGKARTAALFQKPTRAFEEVIKDGRTAMVALNDFTPLQGGVPIVVDGKIVGAVGVSGAASAQQDEQLAIAGAQCMQKTNTSTGAMPPVNFYPNSEVSSSFQRGAVLFDGMDRNYMIHTSRREKPGMAEVHTSDADLVYVLSGQASLVTGGRVLQGANIASDEIRGEAIDGGETRQLAKGDVIVIPAGVPHWFKQVSNPFLYYVVKVR
jgi:glc operon protein GlcG